MSSRELNSSLRSSTVDAEGASFMVESLGGLEEGVFTGTAGCVSSPPEPIVDDISVVVQSSEYGIQTDEC